MKRNLVGSIYGRPSIKIANFIPIHEQTWPPQAIHVYDCMLSKKIFFCVEREITNKYRYYELNYR
jgi:hypothetical protein